MEESNPRRNFAGTRLYAILARKASTGVVFRRGPSKQVLAIHWDTAKHEFRTPLWVEFIENTTWRKSHGEWAIEMRLQGLHEREGPWYVMEHQLIDRGGTIVHSIGRSDWADWSRSGEVLFARSGRLYRISLQAPGHPEELIDLRGLEFEEVAAPQDAKMWSGRGPRGRVLNGSGK